MADTLPHSGRSRQIPASSVNVSGGSLNTGEATVTLSLNTCDVPGFTTSSGPCGTFDVTFVEVPASIGGCTATRGDTPQMLPGGGKVVTNGNSLNVGGQATGTALNYSFGTSLVGSLTQQSNVTVTITKP